ENVEPKLVVGNTSAGIYKDIKPKVIIDISKIPELQIIKRHEFGIEVGAAVTIAKLIEVLDDTNAITDDILDPVKGIYTGNLVFQGIANHLKKLASGFIRNTASVGGNLIMAQKLSFDSDVATVLLGAGASVKIISPQRLESVFTMEEFLDKPCLDSGALLLSVCIPHWNEVSNPREINGYVSEKLLFKTYRAAPRPLGNAVSYVNAAFLAQISPNKTQRYQVGKNLRLAFGAFGVKHAIRATGVEEFLVDKVLSPGILLEAIEMLKGYIIPRGGTSKSAYRQSVAVGFLFDFLCPFVKDVVPPCIVDSVEAGSSQNGIGKWSSKPKSLTVGKQAMKFHDEYNPVGQPSQKVFADLQASGEAVYVDDIPAPENCLYGAFVLSEKALALINKVDVKHALESPTVVSYISSTDIPKQGRNLGAEAFFGGEVLFAEDTVEWVGQPIGLMVAKTWHDAKRAAAKASVEYDCETLGPPILSVEDAGEKKSFFEVPEWCAPKPVGDFAEGMSKADHRIESAEVRIGSQYYFYLETQTALAIPDEDECMVVYSSCQLPSSVQTTIAKSLGIPIHNVRVITRRVGGGFGGKGFRAVPKQDPAEIVRFLAEAAKYPIKIKVPPSRRKKQPEKKREWESHPEREGKQLKRDPRNSNLTTNMSPNTKSTKGQLDERKTSSVQPSKYSPTNSRSQSPAKSEGSRKRSLRFMYAEHCWFGSETLGSEFVPVEVETYDADMEVWDENQPPVHENQQDNDQNQEYDEEEELDEPQGDTSHFVWRSIRITRSPERYSPSCDSAYASVTDVGEPSSYQEACKVEDASKWRAAMEEEMEALHKNKMWELVPLPKERKAIGNKWVLKLKKNINDNTKRYKARSVAKGYVQKSGIDFNANFSPVVRLSTIRVVLTIVASLVLELE
ncbi:hypothetical protein KI387_017979, partial [Taxus chinensis]